MLRRPYGSQKFPGAVPAVFREEAVSLCPPLLRCGLEFRPTIRASPTPRDDVPTT